MEAAQTYSIALQGYVDLKAEVTNENGVVSARGELVSGRTVLISLLSLNKIYTLTRRGFFRRWWQLLDEDENLVYRSLPRLIAITRTMYARTGEPKLSMVGGNFYDDKDEIIASIKGKGVRSREYELETKPTSPLTNEVIIFAIGIVLFQARDAQVG